MVQYDLLHEKYGGEKVIPLITISFRYFKHYVLYKTRVIRYRFIQVGDDTRVSKKSVFHGIKEGVIGNSVRIDDTPTLKEY